MYRHTCIAHARSLSIFLAYIQRVFQKVRYSVLVKWPRNMQTVFGTDEFAETCVMRAIKENWCLLTVWKVLECFVWWDGCICLVTLALLSSTWKVNFIFVCVAFFMSVKNFYKIHFLETIFNTNKAFKYFDGYRPSAEGL